MKLNKYNTEWTDIRRNTKSHDVCAVVYTLYDM